MSGLSSLKMMTFPDMSLKLVIFSNPLQTEASMAALPGW